MSDFKIEDRRSQPLVGFEIIEMKEFKVRDRKFNDILS